MFIKAMRAIEDPTPSFSTAKDEKLSEEEIKMYSRSNIRNAEEEDEYDFEYWPLDSEKEKGFGNR